MFAVTTVRREQNVKNCLSLFFHIPLSYDAVLLLQFFSCLLFISQWCCLNTLPDKSNCPNLFKRASETYGAK